jgi:hypothetical protein
MPSVQRMLTLIPKLQELLLAILSKAQGQRGIRRDWIAFEQQTMLDAVNRMRAERGDQPITLATLLKKERLAVGHVDYSSKFALYCAELVMAP